MENDNLEIIYLKCPLCLEVSKTDQWVTMKVKTTSCSASFSFMDSKPKDTNMLICPKCKKETHYKDIIEAMMREMLTKKEST